MPEADEPPLVTVPLMEPVGKVGSVAEMPVTVAPGPTSTGVASLKLSVLG
jgi:hypothetical protein